MVLRNLISVTDFCTSHDISQTLVVKLKSYGLVEIVEENNVQYIPEEELPKVEKVVRLYFDLDINLEGIEVITQLLNRMETMQQEMTRLKNRLRLYE